MVGKVQIQFVAEKLEIKWLPVEEFQLRPGRALIMADGNISVFHSSRDSFGFYSPGTLRKILFSDAYKKTVAVDCTGCGDCPHKDICEKNRIRRPSEWFRDMHPEIPYCRRVLDEAGR